MRRNFLGVWALGAALAAGSIATAHAGEQLVTRNNVSYVSGGIGVDSQERLNARASQFNLKLVFALVEGNYLADVGVTISDAAGRKIVEHLADGPFFLAKLPAGVYTVTANHDNKPLTRGIKVGGSLRTEYFRWPANPATDIAGPR